MKNVRDILPEVYRQGADKHSSGQDLALAYWPVVVGQAVAEHTRPVMLLGNRLVVDADSLAWRRQLARMSPMIAAKLNRAVGRAMVEGIDFRVATPKTRPMGRATSAAGIETAEDDAAGIADAGLRRIYRLSKRRQTK